jgi:hypothetical protein
LHLTAAAEPPRREKKSPHEIFRVLIAVVTTMFAAEVRLEGEAVKNSLGSPVDIMSPRVTDDALVEPKVIEDFSAGRGNLFEIKRLR